MDTAIDYVTHLTQESARFTEIIREVPSDKPVPSCPEWTADDLLWHLGNVQWSWGVIIGKGLTGPEAQKLRPERPAGRAALCSFFERASGDLQQLLASSPPDAYAWTWSNEQTVGFILRRQAHEAFIHRIDAELTAGSRTAMDQRLSADGIDEVLCLIYGGLPEWGQFTPQRAETIRLSASDTQVSWLVTLGQFTGTDPEDGTFYSEPDIHAEIDSGGPAAATIRGNAADLDCWLWHRPPSMPIDRSGSQSVLDQFESIIKPGVK
jgi:uncharacterized protein (TIGR03083 family)